MMEHQIQSSFQIDWIRSCVLVGYEVFFLTLEELRKILYPKLVCFGYHFLENLPFSLHYCYVKITIFHPVVSKIKLRFYLKPGNREPMFECWDESGSEHPDSAGRSLSFPQPTRSWATGQPISTLYSFTDCESQGYSWRPEVSEEVFSPAGKFHSYHIYLGGWVGADCVIFFQEIESNLRSMEVQFGMNDFS